MSAMYEVFKTDGWQDCNVGFMFILAGCIACDCAMYAFR